MSSPAGGRPELDGEGLEAVTFYTRTLAVPARRSDRGRRTDTGQEAFAALGCSACHVPDLRTGPSDIVALDRQVIWPYTDLLLHDLGPGLADARPVLDGPGAAAGTPDVDPSGREWRTPPLWGIGRVEGVNGHTRFLHDGRARSLEEAILWHGGEAQPARDRFRALDATTRAAVLAFLEEL